LIKRYI